MGKISMSLNEQERLLVHIRSLLIMAVELHAHLQTAANKFPQLTAAGEASQRLFSGENGNEINRYLTKAQTFQSLVEVLYKHTHMTYKEFINTDRILAMDIVNHTMDFGAEDYESKDSDSKEEQERIKAERERINAEREKLQNDDEKSTYFEEKVKEYEEAFRKSRAGEEGAVPELNNVDSSETIISTGQKLWHQN